MFFPLFERLRGNVEMCYVTKSSLRHMSIRVYLWLLKYSSVAYPIGECRKLR